MAEDYSQLKIPKRPSVAVPLDTPKSFWEQLSRGVKGFLGIPTLQPTQTQGQLISGMLKVAYPTPVVTPKPVFSPFGELLKTSEANRQAEAMQKVLASPTAALAPVTTAPVPAVATSLPAYNPDRLVNGVPAHAFPGTQEHADKMAGVDIYAKAGGGGGFGEYATALQQFSQREKERMTAQTAEEEKLLSEFEAIRGRQETPSQMFTSLQEKYGVPEILTGLKTTRGQMATTEDLLANLEKDVTARTTGALMTEAERRRKVAVEREPLTAQYGSLAAMERARAAQLGDVTGLISSEAQMRQAAQARELEPVQLRLATISDRYARETTGYTNAAQYELVGLLDKLARERTLSDREWTQTSELAKLEREYELKKELARISPEGGAGLNLASLLLGGAAGVTGEAPTTAGTVTTQPTAPKDYLDYSRLYDAIVKSVIGG